MSIFSWIIRCNKPQWLQANKRNEVDGCTLYIKTFMFFALIVLVQPKRTRVVYAREDVQNELPITICFSRIAFYSGDCKLSGVALFQPQELFGFMFLIFVVCILSLEGLVFSIIVSVLIGIVAGIGITINCKSSLMQIHKILRQLF